MLSVSGLQVAYGGLIAVRDVSFTVEPGQVLAMLGANGAGKTTTLRAVSGLVRPRAGTVTVDGVDVTGVATATRTRLGRARTFQVVQLFGGMTVLENVKVAGHRFTRSGTVSDALWLPWRGRALREARERALACLEYVGLAHLADVDAGSLPVGQARLVELARALCLKPRVLLLAEPASGLDPGETGELVELLGRIRAALGCAMLLVEHDMGVVMPLCDHVVVMNFGKVLGAGSPAEVRDDADVLEAYLGTVG
jgi:branched-chain amino acid transport system ATP-binding protein